MREVAQVLDWAAGRAAREVGSDGRLDAGALAALPPAVAKRLLAQQALVLGATLEARHLDAALDLAARARQGSAELRLPRLVLRREYGVLALERATPGDSACEVTVTDGEPPEGPYVVRRWQPGDRMRPAALRGHSRKLQDLFTDRKVPTAVRRRAVVVIRARDAEIVWAEHVGPAASARLQVTLTRPDPTVI
jgi:tRNA(Ile)-lysidine synthase